MKANGGGLPCKMHRCLKARAQIRIIQPTPYVVFFPTPKYKWTFDIFDRITQNWAWRLPCKTNTFTNCKVIPPHFLFLYTPEWISISNNTPVAMIHGVRYSPVNQFKTSVSARLVGVCGEVVPWSVDCILRGHFSHSTGWNRYAVWNAPKEVFCSVNI